jgi:hypothetical protein
MPITKTFDCRDEATAYTFQPYGWACWYTKSLPATLKGKAGPVIIPCPECNCYDLPRTEVDITLERASDCQWSADLWSWVCSAFQQPIVLFVTPWEKILQSNPDINPITNVFQLGQAINVTGSCSYDPETGLTTGEISGIVQYESDCFCPGQACQLPVKIFFNEQL